MIKTKQNWWSPKNGKKGSNCFTTFYCSICHKDKLLVLLDKCKDKLLDNPKIYDLIKAWEDYGFSTDTIIWLDVFLLICPMSMLPVMNVDSFWDQLWNWPLIWNRHPVNRLKQQNGTVKSLVPHKKVKW